MVGRWKEDRPHPFGWPPAPAQSGPGQLLDLIHLGRLVRSPAQSRRHAEDGWTGNASSAGKVAVARDQYGFVHLAGGAGASSGAGPAFVLLSSDRPSHTLEETTSTFGVTTRSVVISPNGSVHLYGQQTGTSGVSSAGEFTTLTTINF